MNSSCSIGAVTPQETKRSAWGYGSARNKRRSTTLNTAVVAPIPSASVMTATAVKPGFFANVRIPYRKSWRRVVITHRSVVRAIADFRLSIFDSPRDRGHPPFNRQSAIENPQLLIAQRHHRVDFASATRRDVARDH